MPCSTTIISPIIYLRTGTQWVHVSTATGRVLVLYTGHLLHVFSGLVSLAVLMTSPTNKFAVRKQFAWTADTSGDWRVVRLSSLWCCCSDWMLKISSSVQNNLASFDWLRTEADHLLILTST